MVFCDSFICHYCLVLRFVHYRVLYMQVYKPEHLIPMRTDARRLPSPTISARTASSALLAWLLPARLQLADPQQTAG